MVFLLLGDGCAAPELLLLGLQVLRPSRILCDSRTRDHAEHLRLVPRIGWEQRHIPYAWRTGENYLINRTTWIDLQAGIEEPASFLLRGCTFYSLWWMVHIDWMSQRFPNWSISKNYCLNKMADECHNLCALMWSLNSNSSGGTRRIFDALKGHIFFERFQYIFIIRYSATKKFDSYSQTDVWSKSSKLWKAPTSVNWQYQETRVTGGTVNIRSRHPISFGTHRPKGRGIWGCRHQPLDSHTNWRWNPLNQREVSTVLKFDNYDDGNLLEYRHGRE